LKINSFKIFDVTKNFLTQNFYPSHKLHSIKFLHPHCNVTRKRKLRSKISTFHSISHLGGDRLPFLAYNIFFDLFLSYQRKEIAIFFAKWFIGLSKEFYQIYINNRCIKKNNCAMRLNANFFDSSSLSSSSMPSSRRRLHIGPVFS
jgi:hypothetical protein